MNQDTGLTGLLVTALATIAIALGARFLSRRRGAAALAAGGSPSEDDSDEQALVACLAGDCGRTWFIDPREARRLTDGKKAMTSYFNDDFAFYGAPVESMPMPCPGCGGRVAWVAVERKRRG